MLKNDAVTMISKAKTRLLFEHPFFSFIINRMPAIDVEAEKVPLPPGFPRTMATDGRNLYYYKEFVEELTLPELIGVLVHEVWHVAYLHPLRRGDRDPTLWNWACDYAINPYVLEMKFELPKDRKTGKVTGLVDMKYKGMSAEQIYEILLKQAHKFSIGKDADGNEMWGMIMEPTGDGQKPLSDAEKRAIEEETKLNVQAAAQIAKSRGNLPGALEGLIEAQSKPKVNWREYIQMWVKGHFPDDYTWRRPNRNVMANYGMYMPSMESHGSGRGVLSIDTSGSVSDAELTAYVQEIVGVIGMCHPEKLYIIQHDAVIQRIDVWEAGEPFDKLKISGRGGTCIAPVFKKVDNWDDEPIDWMICFSDMEIGDFPSAKNAPPFPVLWCCTGKGRAPFGEHIDLDLGD